jgi:hypothetical protein
LVEEAEQTLVRLLSSIYDPKELPALGIDLDRDDSSDSGRSHVFRKEALAPGALVGATRGRSKVVDRASTRLQEGARRPLSEADAVRLSHERAFAAR